MNGNIIYSIMPMITMMLNFVMTFWLIKFVIGLIRELRP